MKRLIIVPVTVLLLLPLIALSSDGSLRPALASGVAASLRQVLSSPSQPASEAETVTDPFKVSIHEPAGPASMPAPVVTVPAAQTPTAHIPVTQVPAAQAPVAQAPAPQPDPVSTWSLAPALQLAVTRAMTGFPGRYSVAVQNLTTGERWVLNADDRYHPASTIKLPVTLYALEQYRTGKLKWNEGIVYTEADFESPGGGAFETAPFGGIYPIENLVSRAIKYSNNVAVNMLGRRLGWNNIRAWTRSIDGELYRLPNASPSVSVMSELGWWLHLHRVSQEDPKSANLIMQPLRDVTYQGRIAAGLPDGVSYVHKFGAYNGNFHDGGIIFGKRPFALVVLTNGAKEHEADAAIAKATAAVYKVLTQPEAH